MTFWLISQLKITYFACLLESGLKLIFHWKVHLLFLKKSLFCQLICMKGDVANKREKNMDNHKINLHLTSFVQPWLVFSRFFDFRGNLGNVKEKPTRKTCFCREMKRLTLRIYLAKCADRVSIVILKERNVDTGENKWEVLKTKAWA